MIENDIFKKAKLVVSKLEPYGFTKEKNKYIYSCKIIDDRFRVDVEISPEGHVKGKIIELVFNEEYNNFRIEGLEGEFVNRVREEYKNILINIKEECFIENAFVSNQGNRIANLILKKYNDKPEFLWDKTPQCGVFRNLNNNKWYAIIMNISGNKIGDDKEIIEIVNVKLKEEEITNLLTKKGFYPAYHMNKKSWITISLNDTLSDEEIMKYIDKSKQIVNTLNKR